MLLGGRSRAGYAGGLAPGSVDKEHVRSHQPDPSRSFSPIPGYHGMEKAPIPLTHVCRGWREQLISCPSLWTFLDCASVDQTRVYLERSKTSPLDIYFGRMEYNPFLNDAFLLTIPHLGRLKSLSITAFPDILPELTNHFLQCRAPLLNKLRICSTPTGYPPSIQAAIFDGDPSSLRELRLCGILTNFPWKGLSNLTTFDFRDVPSDEISVTQLLDFFERAPLLHKVTLYHAFPKTSDAPRGRIVPLPHLKSLDITARPVHSILLNHLSILPGASLILDIDFKKSPISAHLPGTFNNLGFLSHITSINLRCEPRISLRLEGSTGGLYMRDLR
jgi:hypothetical protein